MAICIEVAAPLQLGGVQGVAIFAHLLDGEFTIGGELFAAGESLLLMPGEMAVTAMPQPASGARLALCRVKQRD